MSARSIFAAFEAECARRVGLDLFTIMMLEGGHARRLYSSRPDIYPVSGRKKVQETAWSRHVLRDQKSFIAADPAAIRAHFSDHEVILGLGLLSGVNLPVLHQGETLGAFNLFRAKGAYDAAAAAALAPLASRLVSPLLTARRA